MGAVDFLFRDVGKNFFNNKTFAYRSIIDRDCLLLFGDSSADVDSGRVFRTAIERTRKIQKSLRRVAINDRNISSLCAVTVRSGKICAEEETPDDTVDSPEDTSVVAVYDT